MLSIIVVKGGRVIKKIGFIVVLASTILASFGASKSFANDALHIAVASNFLATLKAVSRDFTQETGIKVHISNGATGMLYAQIQRGAPYDLFFSADSKRPLLLEQKGVTEPGSRFTYVIGKLVAWSPNPENISANLSSLQADNPALRFMAIANPKTAPYGEAAKAVLEFYGLYAPLKTENKLALGENIGKAYHYVISGNAQIGLVAKSYVANPEHPVKGEFYDIPSHLYPEIAQQAVILKGKNSQAVQAFLNYFKSAKVQSIIEFYGYGLPSANQVK